jgi:hypothetical protein
VLPRRERLESHLALEREVEDPKVLASNRLSATSWMHRGDLCTDADIDDRFLDWVREAYHLRDRLAGAGARTGRGLLRVQAGRCCHGRPCLARPV